MHHRIYRTLYSGSLQMKNIKKKYTRRRIFCLILILLVIGFLGWISYSYQSQEIDKSILQSNSIIEVAENNDFYSFTPKNRYDKIVLFFPGALVDPKAYTPLCKRISEKGYKVFLIKMPWRLAIYGYNKPKELCLFADTTKQYILVGHSLGGKMAAQFVYENPGLIDKLILIATIHPKDIDLSKIKIPILKIYGSKDGIQKVDAIVNNKPKLALNTTYILIKGANHAQFGYYGFQLGDYVADITREQQQQITFDAMLSFIKYH